MPSRGATKARSASGTPGSCAAEVEFPFSNRLDILRVDEK